MSPSTDMRENREFASEIKFLVSPAIAGLIRDWVCFRLLPDPNAAGPTGDSYMITSLYFDTEQSDVFHRRGSYGRSKYRIRRYGAGDVVFLERKLKTHGLLAKRRSIVNIEDLSRLEDKHIARGWPGFWFHRRLDARELRPVCQISYHRTARVAMTNNGPIRLTLDENLSGLPVSGTRYSEEAGTLLLVNQIVLELKFRREMPVLFKTLVEEFALCQQTFSKYRLAAATLGLAEEARTETLGKRTLSYAA